ncbi:MAG: hypothetical protein OCC49_13465 [Fibrobacterales bacterium]
MKKCESREKCVYPQCGMIVLIFVITAILTSCTTTVTSSESVSSSADIASQIGSSTLETTPQSQGIESSVASSPNISLQGSSSSISTTHSSQTDGGDVTSSSLVSTQSSGSQGTLISSSNIPISSSSKIDTRITIIDGRDGQVYKTTTIGTQTWMAENLRYDPGDGTYCYEHLQELCDRYGRLYDWVNAYADTNIISDDERFKYSVCPEGWRIPDHSDWDTLAQFLVTQHNTPEKKEQHWPEIGTLLKTTHGWNYAGNGSDTYGFSGLPGGVLLSNGQWEGLGERAIWWSASNVTYGSYIFYTLNFDNDSLGGRAPQFRSTDINYAPMRCLWDSSEPLQEVVLKSTQDSLAEIAAAIDTTTSFVDTRDNQRYAVTTIGTQDWMAENLNYATAEGSYCYDENEDNCKIFGRYYNWDTAMNNDVCPANWHIPSNDEWYILTQHIAADHGIQPNLFSGHLIDQKGDAYAINQYLRASHYWGGVYKAHDPYEFAALPSGYGSSDTIFKQVFDSADWWSSTEENRDYVLSRSLDRLDGFHSRLAWKALYFPIRCVAD